MTQIESVCLLVEDEPQMRKFLRVALTSHDYKLIESETAREALQLITSHQPDFVLLDLGLPDGDGIELTKQIRQWSQVPIIVISARGREEDKVLALDAGADDYLTKPFGVKELLARIRVALRHAHQIDDKNKPSILEFGELRIDLSRREVFITNEMIHLTPIEYKLIIFLAQHAGKVLTHRQILLNVWGAQYAAQSHYVRVHMAELRKKIEKNPAQPQLIMTEPGVGYRLRDVISTDHEK